MFNIYIIYSISLDRYYVGYTQDLVRRLSQQNQGIFTYTSKANVWVVKYTESYTTRTDAKNKVKLLMNEFGWKNENILDLGDISSSRGTEAILPVWLRIWSATQNGAFNFKVVS